MYRSQFGQDRELEKLLPNQKRGYFIEAGAFDGVTESNTKYFEDLGWDGLCIEPVLHLFQACQRSRSCTVVNALLYDVDGAEVLFADGTMVGKPGHSGVKDDLSSSLKNGSGSFSTFKTKTLETVLREVSAPKIIDFLSLDTEGSEWKILSVFPFDMFTIKVICVEHNFVESSRAKIRELLLSKGYREHIPTRVEYDDWYVLSSLSL